VDVGGCSCEVKEGSFNLGNKVCAACVKEGVMPRVKHVKAREVRSGMWPHFISRSQWVLVDVKTR
jgi:hypothetical protein